MVTWSVNTLSMASHFSLSFRVTALLSLNKKGQFCFVMNEINILSCTTQFSALLSTISICTSEPLVLTVFP